VTPSVATTLHTEMLAAGKQLFSSSACSATAGQQEHYSTLQDFVGCDRLKGLAACVDSAEGSQKYICSMFSMSTGRPADGLQQQLCIWQILVSETTRIRLQAAHLVCLAICCLVVRLAVLATLICLQV
jgi:hypothetical protein